MNPPTTNGIEAAAREISERMVVGVHEQLRSALEAMWYTDLLPILAKHCVSRAEPQTARYIDVAHPKFGVVVPASDHDAIVATLQATIKGQQDDLRKADAEIANLQGFIDSTASQST